MMGLVAVESPRSFRDDQLDRVFPALSAAGAFFREQCLPADRSSLAVEWFEKNRSGPQFPAATVSVREITNRLQQVEHSRSLNAVFQRELAASDWRQGHKLNGELSALPVYPCRGVLPLSLAVVRDSQQFLQVLPQLPLQQLWQWFLSSWQEARRLGAGQNGPLPIAPKSDKSLRLLSYNICGSRLLFPIAARVPQRFQRLEAGLRDAAADVLTLQEAWNRTSRRLAVAAGYAYVACADPKPGLVGNSGLLTASHFPITAQQFYPFKQRSGIELFCRKGALFTEHSLPQGRRLQIWNVHLASAPEGLNRLLTTNVSAAAVREMQLKELRSWVAERGQAGIPCLLAGDFNYGGDLSELGLDLYRERYPQVQHDKLGEDLYHGVTFDPVNNALARGRLDEPERLDRVVLFAGVRESVSVGAQPLFDRPGAYLSDHSAICIDLSLN